jgi:hypothetical protein
MSSVYKDWLFIRKWVIRKAKVLDERTRVSVYYNYWRKQKVIFSSFICFVLKVKTENKQILSGFWSFAKPNVGFIFVFYFATCIFKKKKDTRKLSMQQNYKYFLDKLEFSCKQTLQL